MNVLQFMSDSPILTFVLVLITGEIVIRSIRAMRGLPEHCDGCRCGDDQG